MAGVRFVWRHGWWDLAIALAALLVPYALGGINDQGGFDHQAALRGARSGALVVLALLLVVATIAIVTAPGRVYRGQVLRIRELNATLDDLTRRRVCVGTGESGSYYQNESGFDLLRVSVENLSGVPIHGVRAVMSHVTGTKGATLPLPIPLPRMHDNITPPATRFDLLPGAPEFLDVAVLANPAGPDHPRVFVAAHRFAIPQGRLEVATSFDATISISAEDMPPVELGVRFSIRARKGENWRLKVSVLSPVGGRLSRLGSRRCVQ